LNLRLVVLHVCAASLYVGLHLHDPISSSVEGARRGLAGRVTAAPWHPPTWFSTRDEEVRKDDLQAGLDGGLDFQPAGSDPHRRLVVVDIDAASLHLGLHLHDLISFGGDVWRAGVARPATASHCSRATVPWSAMVITNAGRNPSPKVEKR